MHKWQKGIATPRFSINQAYFYILSKTVCSGVLTSDAEIYIAPMLYCVSITEPIFVFFVV